ncbi:Retrovirus-related Pol polyprotein [Biomphalaria glabrata]|nr:Retrovirus-related Pol polyprotein [Biomphalaria glabrata]
MKKSQLDKVTRKKECKLAFQALKMYTSYPVLKLPDLSPTFMLRTDASDSGLVAVLMQMAGEAGLLFLVAYASRKLNQVEQECLALVSAIEKFQTYLYDKHFILQTLSYLSSSKHLITGS